MRLRKLWSSVLAVLTISAVCAESASSAQRERPTTAVTARMAVTPTKAGTPERPQGVAVHGSVEVVTEPGFDPPIITGEDFLFGEGFSYNGDRYPRCAKVVLDLRGPAACPHSSIMGRAWGTGRADTVMASMRVTLFNAGAARLLAYAEVDHPTRVRRAVVVSTQELLGGWRHRSSFMVPTDLQVIAGIPIQLNNLHFSLGGRPWAKDYITTTSCPEGGWRYQSNLHYLYDSLGETRDEGFPGAVACTS